MNKLLIILYIIRARSRSNSSTSRRKSKSRSAKRRKERESSKNIVPSDSEKFIIISLGFYFLESIRNKESSLVLWNLR